MPLAELLKMYNYGGAAAAETESAAEATDSGKRTGPPDRLRDVRPERSRHDKNEIDGSKRKPVDVRNAFKLCKDLSSD
jgi:hypothetical protein